MIPPATTQSVSSKSGPTTTEWRKPVRRAFRFRHWSTLRTKIFAILAGGLLFAILSSLALYIGIRKADSYLAHASAAQEQLERLMLLSGRITDYGLNMIISLQSPDTDGARIAHGRQSVEALLESLQTGVAHQVSLQKTEQGMNAAATKSIAVARMAAQFKILDRQMTTLATTPKPVAEKVVVAQQILNAFGIGFSPMIAQAIEDERRNATAARGYMTRLRDQLTGFSIVSVVAASLLALILYLTAARSIVHRIKQTNDATHAIASGDLDTRLDPAGHDELTLLMARFNRMAGSLSSREKKLITAQNELRQTVAERTSELSKANARLTEIDNNRRRFFSDVSHELRTPLTVILGEAEASLRQRDDLPAPVQSSFDAILAKAYLLRRRIDDMLRVARSESGRLDLQFAHVDLNETVAAAIGDVESLAAKKNITIHNSAAAQPLAVSGDREWLRQVVSGVLTNAIKFTPDGKSISITASQNGHMAQIDIADEGPGIPKEDLENILDRFYRGRRRAETDEVGHGIGLALVKWVLEGHHGNVQIYSPPSSADNLATDDMKSHIESARGTLVRLNVPSAGFDDILERAT